MKGSARPAAEVRWGCCVGRGCCRFWCRGRCVLPFCACVCPADYHFFNLLVAFALVLSFCGVCAAFSALSLYCRIGAIDIIPGLRQLLLAR